MRNFDLLDISPPAITFNGTKNIVQVGISPSAWNIWDHSNVFNLTWEIWFFKIRMFLRDVRNIVFPKMSYFHDKLKTFEWSHVFQAVGEIPTLTMFLVPLKVIVHRQNDKCPKSCKLNRICYSAFATKSGKSRTWFSGSYSISWQNLKFCSEVCRTTPVASSEFLDSNWEIRATRWPTGVDCDRLNWYLAWIWASQDLVRATL